MSFMYNPFPYDDPRAVNNITLNKGLTDTVSIGLEKVSANIVATVKNLLTKQGNCILSLDGYISAPFEPVTNQIGRFLVKENISVTYFHTSRLYLEESVLEKKLLENLPQDRTIDPPLLYGKLFDEGYEALMDEQSIEDAVKQINSFKENGKGVFIISGNGSLIKTIREISDIRLYLDMTQKRTVLNIKEAKAGNIGFPTPRPYKETLKHAYYVDFEVASALRGEIIQNGELDYYLASDNIESIRMIPLASYISICDHLASYPLRCRPVYNEGVWGGFYVKHLRNLPDAMKNCAWVFDLIPLEVSIALVSNGIELEFPFYGFVQTVGEKLMGTNCVKKFDGYFPIRFNYDDTFHASGNMSIQCHPDSAYVKKENNELGRQDESYYIVVAGQEAKTYCGFTQDGDVEEFIAKCKLSEKDGKPFDFETYVNYEHSIPGKQFLIPAGTIHASGRNQVILEIGSLTVGSYTYKMYDYVRKDLDGTPRPIHSIHGDAVLRRERKKEWVNKHLIQQPRMVRKNSEGKEIIVGEHELLYFTLRNLLFTERFTDETTDRFHVLSLVEGEKVLIRSLSDPSKFFIQEYLDIIIIPASFGKYEMVNLGVGSIVIHKTMLRDGYEQIER